MARELRSACQIEDMVHVALGRLNVTLTKARWVPTSWKWSYTPYKWVLQG